ncbi:hypothetical protein MYCTH_2112541 [Thermothelomyces thermophilus ATCC 42464]|uniref:2-oxoadipate dioxygenase/decarboxylase n=1 Tax=Thermothelomyces thermophilus (strain ATCC 42464 / BCRC 31852 / DSM 1799) TaxID=573729 RepID=G2QMT0_THET4|nr:uncharacterized protein MYCTH_2112541 [Thermothelomyces thermophilus ATCC 42464]AEO60470.1 hypothetical protein MYCTH_2112541 [Thermothelomyces thermophilus ATCC 42464]
MQNGTTSSWDADLLRSRFVRALSDMYRNEVPLYGQLVDIVQGVDRSVLASRGQSLDDLPKRHQLERHGAIRLGTQHEMRMISRLFGIMGMHPVGYYDLKIVGFPLHGTAFRPTSEESLRRNPFRVFTTVLRPDLISSPSVRKKATEILSRRTLFSPRLCELMDAAEKDRSILTASDADELIAEALKIFKWHSRSTVPYETYLSLEQEHPMVADIVCFPSAHINHLTPRTLDIDAVQAEMIAQGLPAKETIEGPPAGRKCEILLRQTSFKALEERVTFSDEQGSPAGGKNGTHTARFGEVEQRGAAVTRKGRELYDRLLTSAITLAEREGRVLSEVLAEAFREYPDDWDELRKQNLVYFRYRVPQGVTQKSLDAIGVAKESSVHMEQLLQAGLVECEAITYEDFLPFSAAGIFTSNLKEEPGSEGNGTTRRKLQEVENSGRDELQRLLGSEIPSEIDLYKELQSASVRECATLLGLKEVLLA